MKPIDEQTWIAWRCKLGARKHESKRLYAAYQEAVADAGGKVRLIVPKHNETWEDAYRAFIDAMPRKPTRFLAMVAEIERWRAAKESVEARKAEGRKRYLRRFARRASPAQKIPRQAEHSDGGILGTGVREQCEAMADSGGSYARSWMNPAGSSQRYTER